MRATAKHDVHVAGPLQVSVGNESPGYMPWSAQGESWVGWTYPYPRPVQASFVLFLLLHSSVWAWAAGVLLTSAECVECHSVHGTRWLCRKCCLYRTDACVFTLKTENAAPSYS